MKQWLVRRGVLATVPVALLMLGFGACSNEGATTGNTKTAATKVPQADGVELAAAPQAASRVARLSRQFIRTPQQPLEPPAFKFPAGVVPPKPAAPHPAIPPSAVLSKGEAKTFLRQGERFRAQIDPYLKEKTLRPATIDLPEKASGFVRVQPDNAKLGVEFATKRARDKSEIEVSDGTASYANAAPGGGELIYRVTADSVEDYVVLNSKPVKPRVDYAVNVSEAAGLRLVDDTLEFLDAQGDPHVRVKPPRVVDANGTIYEAHLSLSGCKYDTNGEMPWGRPVTAPGASECELSVTWDDSNVVYPAIVDPVWATAGSLATARTRAGAVRLATGLIMTCGGVGDLGIAIKSCETFNPAGGGGAGTWSTTTALGTARSDFTMFLLAPASNDVLAVGGNGLYTSERWNNGTGMWTASTGDFGSITGCVGCTPYFNPQQPAMTSDGNYVVLVDYNNAPYRFSTATNTWTNGTQNPSPISPYRYSAMIVQVPGQNTIMRVGGYYNSTYLATAERYKPSTDSWSTPGNATSMTVQRADAAVAILDANRIMIYGGYTGAASSSTAEIYSGSANSWSFTTGPMPNGGSAGQSYRGITAAFHGSGKLLSATDSGMYIYDPAAAATPWSALQANNFNGMGSSANVVTAGSKVLMVPVWPSGGPSGPQTACKLFDFGDKGSQCYNTSECQAGLSCVRDSVHGYIYYPGVCCDTTCTGACSSCEAQYKQSGSGDGTCAGRKTDDYVGDTNCPYQDPSTCGTKGYYCDGNGSCAKYDANTICSSQNCADAATQNNDRKCDGNGTCVAQTTTTCATGYQCNSGSCQTNCYDQSNYCATSHYCQTWAQTGSTANKCYPRKDKGTACSGNTNNECKTGLYCVDGVCCDGTCDGLCQACTNALTGQASGSCKPVLANSNTGECSDNGAATCGQNGKCDGTGACQKYASGTTCVAASCATSTSRYNTDTCNGTGSCIDGGTTNCATGYSCIGGVCQTSCTDDTQCASAYYCDTASKQCVADKTSGGSCARDQMCAGNANCVDGVCCDSSCTGTCRSCLKARTGLAADGICGNTLDDTDPENECAKDVAYPASCQAPGTCDGAGACRVYAKVAVTCAPDKCAGSTLTKKGCNGAGACDSTAIPCYPYNCDTVNNVCKVACTDKTECVDGSFCQNGSCVGQKPNGSSCTSDGECKSTHCADLHFGALQSDPDIGDGTGGAPDDVDHPGVCCDTACDGTCFACKATTKGYGSDGVCEAVKNNLDMKDQCNSTEGDKCGLDGQCNGTGQCRFTPEGTACGATTCIGNAVQGQRCNGKGNCVDKDGTTDCAPYLCRDVSGAFQCTNPCTEDNDCQDGYYCVDSACKKKLANGKACDSSGICNSGFCVDGLCCDVSCNGQCEACDSPGNEGVCTAVQGVPHGTRVKCDHAGEECGGACDGVNAAACKYSPNGTSCGTTTCDNDLAKSSACNGQGECKPNKAQECSPYTCGTDDTCLSRCEQDADCSQGYACDETTQRCLPSAVAATCSEDRLTSVGQNGQSTPCKPFLCVPSSGTCAVSCAFTTDCSPEFVCEPSTKTCLPAPGDTTAPDEACACRAAGATPTKHGYLALAALGFAFAGLRRRTARKSKPSTQPRGSAHAP